MGRQKKEIGPDIGARLRQAREAAGMTIRELAERAEITHQTVVSIEAGRGGGSAVKTMQALAEALAVSPAWLAFGMGEREAE